MSLRLFVLAATENNDYSGIQTPPATLIQPEIEITPATLICLDVQALRVDLERGTPKVMPAKKIGTREYLSEFPFDQYPSVEVESIQNTKSIRNMEGIRGIESIETVEIMADPLSTSAEGMKAHPDSSVEGMVNQPGNSMGSMIHQLDLPQLLEHEPNFHEEITYREFDTFLENSPHEPVSMDVLPNIEISS